MRTYYDVLGVSEKADSSTIRSTYLRLLQIYHPDHNRDPLAGVKTAELIEAYTVLRDPDSRAEYDSRLHPKGNPRSTREPGSGAGPPPSQPPPPVLCVLCGEQNSTLRVSTIYLVFSLLVVTRRQGKSGLWCERCRAKQAALWTITSGVLGWWGIPWGPVYTAQALYYNALGGKQDVLQNASLLRLVAFQLYQEGEFAKSLEAIDSSLRLQRDQASLDFANSIRAMRPDLTTTRRVKFPMMTAVPSVAVCVAVLVGLFMAMNQPTGYAARYEAPVSYVPLPVAAKKTATGRDSVNELVGSMAEAVGRNATVRGKRQEGTTIVTDYILDREKYNPADFGQLAAQIEPFLDNDDANRDGFVSSAFFNAKIMQLSIEIENGIAAGDNVLPSIKELIALGDDPRLSPWLGSSSFYQPYKSLKLRLESASRFYQSNPPQKPTDAQFESLKATINATREAFDQARALGDSRSEKESAADHDRAVYQFNALVRRNNQIVAIQRGLDLAFNRCLDSKVLMSRFNEVNLTTASDLSPETNSP